MESQTNIYVTFSNFQKIETMSILQLLTKQWLINK